MKNLGILLLLIILGVTISIVADLISGISFMDSLKVITHSFVVVTPAEYLFILMAILLPFTSTIKSWAGRLFIQKKE